MKWNKHYVDVIPKILRKLPQPNMSFMGFDPGDGNTKMDNILKVGLSYKIEIFQCW